MKTLQQLFLSFLAIYGGKYVKTLSIVMSRQNWFFLAARQVLGAVLPPKVLALVSVQPTRLSILMRRFLMY